MSKATDGLLDVILEKDKLIAELLTRLALAEAALEAERRTADE